MRYRSGDFYRICDRCGFKYRASQTSKTWDGLYVCRADWEIRHPQDFVRGRKDDQTVPSPRPEPLDTIIGPLLTNISVAASAGASLISVDTSVRFFPADHIGVALNNGNVEPHVVLSVPSETSLQMTTALGGPISAGNVVINYSAVSEPDIG